MTISNETRIYTNANGTENRANARVDNIGVDILNIPGVNIPLWYRRLMQSMGKATTNSTELVATTMVQGTVSVQTLPTVDFPKLCMDFASLNG